MSVQTGSIFSTWVYREDDKPLYRRGNSTLLAINLLSILVFIMARYYYVWRNKQKRKVWSLMTEGQKAEYRKTSKRLGSKSLDFMFAY
jgi:hypothetical protein